MGNFGCPLEFIAGILQLYESCLVLRRGLYQLNVRIYDHSYTLCPLGYVTEKNYFVHC